MEVISYKFNYTLINLRSNGFINLIISMKCINRVSYFKLNINKLKQRKLYLFKLHVWDMVSKTTEFNFVLFNAGKHTLHET